MTFANAPAVRGGALTALRRRASDAGATPVVPWIAALFTALTLAAQSSPATWALVRGPTLGGDYYRVVTGHFVHFNRAHILGDVLAFAFWAAFIEQRSRRLLVATVLSTTVVSSVFFLAMCPGLEEYRGISGVDCALVVQLILLGFVERARAADRPGTALFALAGSAFAAKTTYEFVVGHALLAPNLGEGVALLPASHALGIATGVATLWIHERLNPRKSGGLGAERRGDRTPSEKNQQSP